MSLLGSIQIAAGALSATQLGLQVVGNNIANANTPGYIREDVRYKTVAPEQSGNNQFGLGIQVDGVVLLLDKFLAERMRDAASDLQSSEAQEFAYRQLETLIGELSERDLSSSLTDFFGSVHDVANQPENNAIRNIAILKGETVAKDFRRLGNEVRDYHADLDQEVKDIATNINRLIERISDLNTKVVRVEGGGTSTSDAIGLRDDRQRALNELANYVHIQTFEQASGATNVFVDGEYLVFDGLHREVEAKTEVGSDGLYASTIRIAESQTTIDSSAGRMHGLVTARDEIVRGFIQDLDAMASTLIYEVNKIHADGQGSTGFGSVTSEFGVDDQSIALDQTNLPSKPVNGSFQIQLYHDGAETVDTTDIFVQLNGLETDTTFSDLASAIDAIDGITASIASNGRLSITSDSPTTQFTFADDTSGVLAAIGVNTFFSGSSSRDIAVNRVLRDDPTKLATSRNGIGADTEIVNELASFLNTPLQSKNGESFAELYDSVVIGVTQNSALTQSVTEGFRTFHGALENEHLAISGVNIDEEAINLITLQRAFEASARFITTISDLLEVLINL